MIDILKHGLTQYSNEFYFTKLTMHHDDNITRLFINQKASNYHNYPDTTDCSTDMSLATYFKLNWHTQFFLKIFAKLYRTPFMGIYDL